MTARIGYLTALAGAALPSAGGRGTLRPPRRLFGGFPDAGFQEEPAIWRDTDGAADVVAEAGVAASPSRVPAGQPGTEPPGWPRIDASARPATALPASPGTEPLRLPRPPGRRLSLAAETPVPAGPSRHPDDRPGSAAPAEWSRPASTVPERPDQARAATSAQLTADGAREQAAPPGGTLAPDPAATAAGLPEPVAGDADADAAAAGHSAAGARVRTSRPAPAAARAAASGQPAASGPLPAPGRAPDPARPALSGRPPFSGQRAVPAQPLAASAAPDHPDAARAGLGSPPAQAPAGAGPGGGADPASAPHAQPARPRSGRYSMDPRRAAPHVFPHVDTVPVAASVPLAAAASGSAAERPPGTARDSALEPPAAITPTTAPPHPAPAIVPGRRAEAGGLGAPAPAPAPAPALSIGTIEVTLLAPPPEPPARSARPESRQPPRRLSRGLGPRFGQGQT